MMGDNRDTRNSVVEVECFVGIWKRCAMDCRGDHISNGASLTQLNFLMAGL